VDSLEGGCDRKVVGGKMFRVRVSVEREGQECRMRRLTVLGDFFMHPEEAIEGLEASVCEAYNSGQDLAAAVVRFLDRSGAQLYGGTPVDLTGAVLDAVDDALSKEQGGT
jgi:hypothetical protein